MHERGEASVGHQLSSSRALKGLSLNLKLTVSARLAGQ